MSPVHRLDFQRLGVFPILDYEFLATTPLFAGVAPENVEKMLRCLSIRQRTYEKDAYIFTAEDAPSEIGVVVRGSVHLIKEDYWGNRAIIAKIAAGGVFGEACSCTETRALPFSVVAAERSDILFLNCRKVTTTCPNACPFHAALIQNMLGLIARKNMMLTNKISHLVKRTTREKLLSYFSEQAERAGSSSFTIPFNRQELADYLSVDRSAMSTELGKLRREGLLEFRKNQFTLR